MPRTKASSPATLRNTIRRVRLEKLWAMKKCQACRGRLAMPSVRSTCHARPKKLPVPLRARANASMPRRRRSNVCAAAEARNALTPALPEPRLPAEAWRSTLSAVRSSTLSFPAHLSRPRPSLAHRFGFSHQFRLRRDAADGTRLFLEPVAHSVKRLDHVEVVVGLLELLAQALDVAVNGTVVDIDLIVIGGVHQR